MVQAWVESYITIQPRVSTRHRVVGSNTLGNTENKEQIEFRTLDIYIRTYSSIQHRNLPDCSCVLKSTQRETSHNIIAGWLDTGYYQLAVKCNCCVKPKKTYPDGFSFLFRRICIKSKSSLLFLTITQCLRGAKQSTQDKDNLVSPDLELSFPFLLFLGILRLALHYYLNCIL